MTAPADLRVTRCSVCGAECWAPLDSDRSPVCYKHLRSTQDKSAPRKPHIAPVAPSKRSGPKGPRICRGCGRVGTRSPHSWYCDYCNEQRPGFGKLCYRCKQRPARSPTDSYCRECDNESHGSAPRDRFPSTHTVKRGGGFA